MKVLITQEWMESKIMSDPDNAENEAGTPEPLDEFHKHEALHTAYVVLEIFAAHVQEHRYVQSDPELAAKAQETMDALYAMYNLLGTKTITEADAGEPPA